jgi:GT2 family glycosyltransferase
MTASCTDLTVAIATLDRPMGLAACLDALLSGPVLPAEVIIVDQSNNDRTEVLVHDRPSSGVALIYERQARRGLSASRNSAIARASRPFVAFTDDDCVPDAKWVQALCEAFASSTRPDAVVGPVAPLGPETVDTYVVSPRHGTARVDFRGRGIPWLRATGGNFALRRDWLERVGCYDERLGAGSPGRAAEDADLVYRLLVRGAVFRYEPRAIVYHRRQTRAQRLASRSGYGHGIGAFCAFQLRQGDLYGVWMLTYWLLTLGRELGGQLIRRDGFGAYQRLLGLSGTLAGLVYGFRATAHGG